MNNQLLLIIKIVLILLFLGCLLDVPYSYYQFIRIAGMIGFGFLAINDYEKGEKYWAFFWLSSLLVINPIFKVSLGRDIWNAIDVLWAVVLAYSIFRKMSSD